MTRSDARDEVQTLLTTAWNEGEESSNVPLYYQDVNVDLPIDYDPDTVGITPWALSEIIHRDSKRTSIGINAKRRITAILNVFIFTPLGDGLVLNDAIAQIIENTFAHARSSNIFYRDIVSLEQGRNGAWQSTRTTVTFEYYGE